MATSHAVQTTGGTTVVTTAETVVATIQIPALNLPLGADGVFIAGICNGLAGSGTTAITTRVRQGSLTGAQVGAGVSTPTTAGTGFTTAIAVLDTTTSYPTGNTYVVTVQQTNATGNATGVNATVLTTPANPMVG